MKTRRPTMVASVLLAAIFATPSIGPSILEETLPKRQ